MKKIIFALIGIGLYVLMCKLAFAEMSPVMANNIADAIYLAEGGQSAKKPYGILSVPCETEAECRRICINTIKNNYQRWLKDSKGMTYLAFLASRYAPIGVSNDPKGLNCNWISNVQKFLYGGAK